jgi:hypothetical protein
MAYGVIVPTLEAFTSAPILYGRVVQEYKACPALFELMQKAERKDVPGCGPASDDHLMAALREVARGG